MESREHSTLTPVMKGGGYFTIPHVRMGYEQGVEIQLFEGEYTKKTMEPFAGYMGMWEKQKNSADEVIAKSKEGLTVALKREDKEEEERLSGEIKKATFNRTQSKPFANILPGRNNIKIDRPQTMLTKMCK